MKKYLVFAFCALSLFVVAGCGSKKKVVCSTTMKESGLTIDAEAIGYLDKNDKVTDISIVYDLNDKTAANQYCSIFKLMESDKDSDIKVKCSGTKVTITGLNTFADSSSDESIIGRSKDDFVEYMESVDETKFTCK